VSSERERERENERERDRETETKTSESTEQRQALTRVPMIKNSFHVVGAGITRFWIIWTSNFLVPMRIKG
jgi:hypothetical protein